MNKIIDLFAFILQNQNNSRQIKGKGNSILYKGAKLNGVSFDIQGDNNEIIMGSGSMPNSVLFYVRGSNHRAIIGSNCHFRRNSTIWFEDSKCRLRIGNGTWIEEVHIALTEPGSHIEIGDDSLIANDVDIRCGDSHSIIDISTGKRINQAKDVKIGDHVWLAAHVEVLKGVTIGSNSVIGIRYVVTKDVPPNSLAAGIPAEVIRSNITWDRDRTIAEQSPKGANP